MRRPAGTSRAGFTLIELTLAMGMVTVVALSLYASLRIAFRASDSATAAVEPPRTAELAMEFLRTDLQNALTSGGVLAGTFEGTQSQDDRGHEDDDLIFFTTSDGPDHVDGNGEIKQVELTVQTTPDGTDHVLVRRVTRNLLSEIQVDPDEEIICRGVSSLSLSYFTGSQWQDTWDSTQEDNTIPVAVEVTLELQRPTAAGGATGQDMRTLRFTRVFTLSCSTAAQDENVNTGELMP